MGIKKVIILSHWIKDGEDVIGKEMKVDTDWLESINISYREVKKQDEDKGK